MTKLKPYADYKKSGIGWLPEVPAGWEVARIKSYVRLVTDRAEDRSSPVALENIEGWTGKLVESTTEFAAEGIKFAAGDVLFGKLRPYLAKSWMADRDGEAVGDFFVMRPGSGLNPKFLNFVTLTPEFISMVDGSTFGSKMPRASWDFIANVRHPFPAPEVQALIVSFLDRETAQIDELVGKQERLIELLAEKRQAIVTHAVTKGLDPAAPTRPSGAPWLGEVPEHWDVVGSRRIFRERGERSRMDDEQLTSSQVYGILSQASFVAMTGNRVTSVIKGEEILKHVEPDDFVISMRSFQGGLELSRVRGKISSAYVMLVPDQSIAVEYFRWLFKCDRYISGLQSTSNLVRDGQALRFANFAQLRLPVPPIEEQRAIAAWIEEKLAAMDKLHKRVAQNLDLLRERRSALISAAVTGKIDVTHEGVAA